MKRFLVGTVINAAGLWIISMLVPAIHLNSYFGSQTWQVALSYLAVAAVFGLVQAIIAPVIKVIAFPLYIITFGLISFVINGALLLLVAWISRSFGTQVLTIDGFTATGLSVASMGWAIVGAVIMSVFAFVARGLFKALRIL
jgi:putative membrane protein